MRRLGRILITHKFFSACPKFNSEFMIFRNGMIKGILLKIVKRRIVYRINWVAAQEWTSRALIDYLLGCLCIGGVEGPAAPIAIKTWFAHQIVSKINLCVVCRDSSYWFMRNRWRAHFIIIRTHSASRPQPSLTQWPNCWSIRVIIGKYGFHIPFSECPLFTSKNKELTRPWKRRTQCDR